MVSEEKRERNYSFNSFLVTNKHVIEGAEEVSLFLLNQKKINPLWRNSRI